VEKKLLTMPTDPARVRRNDVGDPKKCPVWQLHQVYSNDDVRDWVFQGCTTAGIGCIDCKKQVVEKVLQELKPIQARAKEFEEDPNLVRTIIAEGCEEARNVARETMEEVRAAMGLNFR